MIARHHPELASELGVKKACSLLGLARATHYRRCEVTSDHPPRAPRPTPPNALSALERQRVLDLLHEPEHCDLAVAKVWSRTLDGHLSRQSINDAPDSARRGRVPRAPRPAHAPGEEDSRVGGDQTQRGLELGHRAPRGALEPKGGARPPPPICRSRLVKQETV
jgi:hypothetical protein